MNTLGILLTAAVWQNLVLIRFAAPWPLAAIVHHPRRAAAVTAAIAVATVAVTAVYGPLAYYMLLPAQLELVTGPAVAATMGIGYLLVRSMLPRVAARRQSTALVLLRLALYNPATFLVALASARSAYLAQQPLLLIAIPLAATAGIALTLIPIAAVRQRQRVVAKGLRIDPDVQVFLVLALYSLGLSQVVAFSQQLFIPLW